jgi:4-hydroxybenzoate polyprenyltransferase
MNNPAPVNKVNQYLKLVKFSHTIFAMPFAMIGYFLAIHHGYPINFVTLLLVVLCMVFARNSAMAFNRYVDRKIDLKNPRTAIREIPAKIIKPQSALMFVIFNSAAFVCTTYFINPITFWLSPAALLVILGYSITKRFTYLCHFVLGLGLSLAPIGAYLSVTGRFDWLPVMFSCIVLFWSGGFDIIYALQDEQFDKTEKLNSIPVLMGTRQAIIFSTIIHLCCALLVIGAGFIGGLGTIYWVGTAVFILLLTYQHYLVRPDDLTKLNMAFFTVNGIASVVFALFTVTSILM